MQRINTEALALVESWVRDLVPQTLSTKQMHLVFELSVLSVYTYKEQGRATCHPGRQYLAELVGWSIHQVSRFTSALRKWQLLGVKQQWHQHAGVLQPGTNWYTLLFLTEDRIQQLARVLGIALAKPIAHMKKLFSYLRKRAGTCERRAINTLWGEARTIAERWLRRGEAFSPPS